MSTFTGDATITDFITAAGTRSTTSGTTIFYTVPVGGFSEVQFISASNSGFGVGTPAATAFAGGVTVFSVSGAVNTSENFNDKNYAQPIWLNEGETVGVTLTIQSSSESVTASFRVKEYNKP